MHFWKSEFIEIFDFKHVKFLDKMWLFVWKIMLVSVSCQLCFLIQKSFKFFDLLVHWRSKILDLPHLCQKLWFRKDEDSHFEPWSAKNIENWHEWHSYQKRQKILKSWGKMIIRFEKVFIEKLICEIFLLILKIFHEKFAKKSAKRDFQSFLCL